MTFSESTHFDQLEEFQKFSEKKLVSLLTYYDSHVIIMMLKEINERGIYNNV